MKQPLTHSGRAKYNLTIVSGTTTADWIVSLPAAPQLVEILGLDSDYFDAVGVPKQITWADHADNGLIRFGDKYGVLYTTIQDAATIVKIDKAIVNTPSPFSAELCRDPDLDNASLWVGTATIANGTATFIGVKYIRDETSGVSGPGTYRVTLNILSNSGTTTAYVNSHTVGGKVTFTGTGVQTADLVTTDTQSYATILQSTGNSVIESVSFKRIL